MKRRDMLKVALAAPMAALLPVLPRPAAAAAPKTGTRFEASDGHGGTGYTIPDVLTPQAGRDLLEREYAALQSRHPNCYVRVEDIGGAWGCARTTRGFSGHCLKGQTFGI